MTARSEHISRKRVTFSTPKEIINEKNNVIPVVNKVHKTMYSGISNSSNVLGKHSIRPSYSLNGDKQTIGDFLTSKQSKQTIKTSSRLSERNDVKKVLIRHSELALPTTSIVKEIPEVKEVVNIGKTNDAGRHCNTKPAYQARYAVPELYSTLCVAKELHTLSKADASIDRKLFTIYGAAKHNVEDRVTSKLNFPLEEQLYKDLVALNVIDDTHKGSSKVRCSYRTVTKDREPILSDFYKPSFGPEYSVISQPVHSDGVDKIRAYNGFSLNKRKQMWEVQSN